MQVNIYNRHVYISTHDIEVFNHYLRWILELCLTSKDINLECERSPGGYTGFEFGRQCKCNDFC